VRLEVSGHGIALVEATPSESLTQGGGRLSRLCP
jgi:hypothetical protein